MWKTHLKSLILTDYMSAKISVLVSALSLVFCDKISGRGIPALLKLLLL